MASVRKMWATARNMVMGILASSVVGMPGAFAMVAMDDIRPYVGVGGQVLKQNMKQGYGETLFTQTIPGGMVFAGARVGRYFGAELGYNYFSRNGYGTLGPNDIFPGSGESLAAFTGVPGSFRTYKKEMLIRDINLGITGYLPLDGLACSLSQTELFAGVGVGRTSVKARLDEIRDNFGAIAPGTTVYSLKQKKTVPFVRIGAQQNITDNVNVAIFSEWKRLSTFEIKALPSESTVFQIRLKNSMSYGLRLGYTF